VHTIRDIETAPVGSAQVECSRKVKLVADASISDVGAAEFDAIALPVWITPTFEQYVMLSLKRCFSHVPSLHDVASYLFMAVCRVACQALKDLETQQL
jgi:hypothetical protein